MNSMVLRKLPSLDWLAVGLAALGLILSRFYQPLFGLLGVAVFGPSLLRELGWLKDSDEWQRGIMHRAGFHAALALALFVFLGRVLPSFELQFTDQRGLWFDAQFLWQTLVLVFLVSYLMQYWGPVQGTSRVLAGFGGVLAIDFILAGMRYGFQPHFWPVAAASVALFFLLAWMAPRWSSLVGILLMLFNAVLAGLAISAVGGSNPAVTAGLAASQMHIFLIFGVTGWALWQSRKDGS